MTTTLYVYLYPIRGPPVNREAIGRGRDSWADQRAFVFYGTISVMKTGTPGMIEGPEAFDRFKDAAKKMFSASKSDIPNPFGKSKRKKPPKSKKQPS